MFKKLIIQNYKHFGYNARVFVPTLEIRLIVLDILIYVFEQYFRSHEGIRFEHEILKENLEEAGFECDQIGDVLIWLEALKHGQKALMQEERHNNYISHSKEEMKKIGANNISVLIKLESFGILNAKSRELVLDRPMALPEKRLSHTK